MSTEDEYRPKSGLSAASPAGYGKGSGQNAAATRALVRMGFIFVAVFLLLKIGAMILGRHHTEEKSARPVHAEKVAAVKTAGTVSHNELVEQMQNELKPVESAFQDLSQRLAGQENILGRLNERLDRLEQDAIRQQQALEAKSQKPATVKAKEYFLSAIVPGRAWIYAGGDSYLRTVTLGDVISGYGTVDHIDVGMGTLHTTSGKLIRYQPGDM